MPSVPPSVRKAPGPAAPEDRAVHLYGLLDGVRRLRLFQGTVRRLLQAIAAWLALALAMVAADAVLSLPASLRVALNAIAVGGALAAVGVVVWEWRRNRSDSRQAARLVECRLGLSDSVLINAVEFASSPPRAESEVLRRRTIELAEERARRLSALEVLSFRPVWNALAWTGAAGAIVLASWLAAPRMFAMVLPRYLDPFGDHPPFTLVTFDVRVDPVPAYYGRPATIAAVLGGPEVVEHASVVFVEESGPQRLPMFRREESTFVLEIDRAETSRRFYIDTPRGRSPTLDFTVLEVPFFEDVSIRYDYPAYTGWESRQLTLHDRHVRGIVGTEVTWTVRSNLPLHEGRMAVRTAAAPATSAPPGARGAEAEIVRLTPTPSDAHLVQGRMRLTRSGTFALTLLSTSGGESLEPLTGTITVAPDKPPRVAIVQPPPHVIVVENWSVPVVVEAVDDVGLSQLRLSRSVNGWGPSLVELPMQMLRPGAARGESGFDLAALGARAGDVITYYATAADNHPAPPQYADSPVAVLQVVSEEDYLQLARQQYQLDELAAEFQAIRQELDALQRERARLLEELEQLRQELEQNPDASPASERLQQAEEQLARYAQQAETLARRLEERAEQLPLYELEQPYIEMLQKLARQLTQEGRQASGALEALRDLREQGASPARRQALQQALEQMRDDAGLRRRQEQFEAAQPDLELFQSADRMLQHVERLQSVIQQQRDLAARFAELQSRPSLSPEERPRADQLAKEQELLEQELTDLTRELRQAAEAAQERLPQMSASARGLCQQIGELRITEDQQQAASKAREGSGPEAHQRAESAAEKLESLAGQCRQCGNAGEIAQGLDGPLSLSLDSVQRSLDQLAQGRSLPGLPRPGSGSGRQPGSGAAGTSGFSGQAEGGSGEFPPDWRPGQSFPGSQARTPILGPRTLVEQPPPRPGGQLGADERGGFLPDAAGDPLGEAEQLTPESRGLRPSAAGNLRGVPVPYRRDAESYFRRLAEDEASR